jgi:hypothetical protein
MISYRYMPIFPQEAELNPIEVPARNVTQDAEPDDAAATAPEAEMAPAEG